MLGLNGPKIIRTSIDRPNVEFIVHKKSNATDDLLETINKTAGSIIVFVLRKCHAEGLSRTLQNLDVKSEYYHGDLSPQERVDKLNKFLKGNIKVIVATISFGMGIDKKDVRCVIHYGGFKYLEA